MADPSEILIGKIAVEQNYLTQEELAECLRIQNEEEPPRPLGAVLLERGYLTKTQLEHILEIQKANLEKVDPHTSQKQQDILFGKLAVEEGLLTQDELKEALRLQGLAEAEGTVVQLGEMMMRLGYLTRSQVQSLLARQQKQMMTCPSCRWRFNVATTATAVPCPKCRTMLVPSTKEEPIDADDSLHRVPTSTPPAAAATTRPTPTRAAPPTAAATTRPTPTPAAPPAAAATTRPTPTPAAPPAAAATARPTPTPAAPPAAAATARPTPTPAAPPAAAATTRPTPTPAAPPAAAATTRPTPTPAAPSTAAATTRPVPASAPSELVARPQSGSSTTIRRSLDKLLEAVQPGTSTGELPQRVQIPSAPVPPPGGLVARPEPPRRSATPTPVVAKPVQGPLPGQPDRVRIPASPTVRLPAATLKEGQSATSLTRGTDMKKTPSGLHFVVRCPICDMEFPIVPDPASPRVRCPKCRTSFTPRR